MMLNVCVCSAVMKTKQRINFVLFYVDNLKFLVFFSEFTVATVIVVSKFESGNIF